MALKIKDKNIFFFISDKIIQQEQQNYMWSVCEIRVRIQIRFLPDPDSCDPKRLDSIGSGSATLVRTE